MTSVHNLPLFSQAYVDGLFRPMRCAFENELWRVGYILDLLDIDLSRHPEGDLLSEVLSYLCCN